MKRQARLVNCCESSVAFILKDTETEKFSYRIFKNISDASLTRLVRAVNARAKAGNGRILVTESGWCYRA